MSSPSIMWFRRDLRRSDHPALAAAAARGPVLPVFVVDPGLAASGGARAAALLEALDDLDGQLDGALHVACGDAAEVVPRLAAEHGASSVHVSADPTPRGRRVDDAVRAGGVELVATGSPYAVGPGLVRTRSGTPFKVFTPFARAWREHGWPAPAPDITDATWLRVAPEPDALEPLRAAARAARQRWSRCAADGEPLPEAGTTPVCRSDVEARWQVFLADGLATYGSERDRPDLDGTSLLSTALALGTIHARSLLHDLGERRGEGAETFRTELAWREFYADVLWHRPDSAWADLRDALRTMDYDEGPETDRLVEVWRQGRTGFPVVDAAMRQLLATGWMHNRMRMLTASFLCKDLHVWWPVGARHFLEHLRDADLASNNHGWQWVAGTGTDASPYFRVFNPVTQGRRFDPDGNYVRRWVPELAHLPGAAVHEPWRHEQGYAHGYPERILDHDEERREALARYERATGRV